MAKKTLNQLTTPENKCAAQHFGPWMIEPTWFVQAVAAVKDGTFKATAEPREILYDVVDGIATIPIVGQMTKGESSFGGTSTVKTRNAIRKAVGDDSVRSIMLHIDSPGGTVAGSRELADDVEWAKEHKPVYAHIDDLGASAAYNVATRANRITANKSSQIGSIGTMAVLEDTSGAAEKAGVKVHVISTGPNKGAGADGAPITEKQIEAYQELVNELGQQFVEDVNRSRGLSLVMGQGAADGRVFIAPQAKKLGLIDDVSSFDAALDHARKEIQMDNEKLEQAERKGYADGLKAGAIQAREELKSLRDALPGKHEFVLDQACAGRTVDEAKALDASIAKATAEKEAMIAAQAAEIAKLKAEAGTQAALNIGATSTGESTAATPKPATHAEALAVANAEWDKDPKVREGFTSKDNYAYWRADDLLKRSAE